MTFAELHAISPNIFRKGRNDVSIEIIERHHAERFWRHCGQAMRELGYARDPSAPVDEPAKAFYLHPPYGAEPEVWDTLRELVGSQNVFEDYRAERADLLVHMNRAGRAFYRGVGGTSALGLYRARLDLSRYLRIATFRDPVAHLADAYRQLTASERSAHGTFRRFIEATPNVVTRQLCGRADPAAAAQTVRATFHRWAIDGEGLPELLEALRQRLGGSRTVTGRAIRRRHESVGVTEEDRRMIERIHGADIEFHRILRQRKPSRVAAATPNGEAA